MSAQTRGPCQTFAFYADEAPQSGRNLQSAVEPQGGRRFTSSRPQCAVRAYQHQNARRADRRTSSGPSIVTVHSIAASLKPAILMKPSWLGFPIPRHSEFLLLSRRQRSAAMENGSAPDNEIMLEQSFPPSLTPWQFNGRVQGGPVAERLYPVGPGTEPNLGTCVQPSMTRAL